ncbi:helix-turn-helix domain-containing protein [Paenibacillus sinopodophylli]|uniref:helix-turn-helix domain-containing protein n=1 Tax=Paenibacillus sinopodophylli TaxID=1837342 RepID=UPI00110CE818|nr:helix-turn-helix domain-containing protein [Paenibacillus sinopodophylli]
MTHNEAMTITYIDNVQNYHTSNDTFSIALMLQASTVIFIVQHGTGTLQLEDRNYSLERGQAYVILPKMNAIFAEHDTDRGVRGFFIAIHFYEPLTPNNDEVRPFRRLEWPFPEAGKLEGSSETEWLSLAEQLLNVTAADGLRAIVQAELMRSKLLLLLMECSETGKNKQSEHVISQSIVYMDKHYYMPLDRHKLARLAGMSVWHYSEQFKKQTGQSPIAYLNAIRIQSAKEKLLSTDLSVIEIARQAGFADEYYFSRKFKHMEGVSPSAYRKLKRNKIAAASFPFTGQLLALEVVPYVAVVDQGRDSHRSSYFNRIPYQLQRSEQIDEDIWHFNTNMLREARPEIIMCSEEEAATYQSFSDSSSKLIVIPWMELDWRQQLCMIADALGKRREAEVWLKDYDRKAKRVAGAIQARIGKAAISIVHVKNGKLYVYGKRNGGSVLFDCLGLQPAYPYEQIAVFHHVSPSELGLFAGDHMLVIVNKDKQSRDQWNSWLQSRIWNDLIPFQKSQVYEVNEMPWLDYSAHGHDLILNEALQLFTNPSYIHE